MRVPRMLAYGEILTRFRRGNTGATVVDHGSPTPGDNRVQIQLVELSDKRRESQHGQRSGYETE
jgi:hypothetical protein